MDGSGQTDRTLIAPGPEAAAPGEIVRGEIVWVDPARGVLEVERLRALAREGAAIGGDPYSAYCAEDGSLPLWPLAAVLDEAKLARRFVEGEIGVPYAGLRVPGPATTCAEGDFLPALLRQEPDVRLGLPRLDFAE